MPFTNNPPIANPDSFTTSAGQTVVLPVLANDTDPDTVDLEDLYLGIHIDTLPAKGTLTLLDGVLTFTASEDDFFLAEETVTFTYHVTDQWNAPSAATTVTITVTGNAAVGETLTGLNPPNTLTGGAGNDQITGGNNKDVLSGLGGADKIFGLNGSDQLFGGEGPDQLNGGRGPDTLAGGAGGDTLTGGEGRDLFVFGGTPGHDVITDFEIRHDLIQVPVSLGGLIVSIGAGPHGGVLIDFGEAGSLWLQNVPSSFRPDFLFSA